MPFLAKFYTHLTALLILLASYLYRPRRSPRAACIRYMRTEYPFDVAERKIDLFLEGLLNG